MLFFYSGSNRIYNKEYLIADIEKGIETKDHYIYGIFTYQHDIVGNIKIGPILKQQNISDLIIFIGDKSSLGGDHAQKIFQQLKHIHQAIG